MSLLFSLSLSMVLNDATQKLNKLYYTIGEVSGMFNVNASLIRFWEKEFTIIKPKKNKKGNRLFTQRDIEIFQEIYKLVKVDGHTLEGAKQKLKRVKNESVENEPLDIIKQLEKIKTDLLALQASL